MKTVNIMNFVRQCEPRIDNFYDKLLGATKAQIALVKEKKVPSTFLLQYDTLCDPNFVDLFKKEADESMELGLWYEIVEPMTSAVGLPYRSEKGWKWDWHIVPGFGMAYTLPERELLIDEAMRKFKEVFGYYPRTLGSWLFDTHTIDHLTEKYEIDALCVCRDQTNTDAYTLVGGYFNGPYYPSKNNYFTPAQTKENRVKVPMFRLLGPCPIFNYDGKKFMSEEMKKHGGCYTLEPAWYSGQNDKPVDALFKCFYQNETLEYAYSQIGQENSFADRDIITPLASQIDKLKKIDGVRFEKMGDSGKEFRETFESTPSSSVVALESWDGGDIQSVYYSSENYVADVFRYEGEVFIRALYLFDERVPDRYETEVCNSFNAEYENLPIVDTNRYSGSAKHGIGITLAENAPALTVEKLGGKILKVDFGDRSATLYPDRIELSGVGKAVYHKYKTTSADDKIALSDGEIGIKYRGVSFALVVDAESATEAGDEIIITGKKIILTPERR